MERRGIALAKRATLEPKTAHSDPASCHDGGLPPCEKARFCDGLRLCKPILDLNPSRELDNSRRKVATKLELPVPRSRELVAKLELAINRPREADTELELAVR
jgi:hypothetical protein